MAAAIKAINAKIRSNKVLDYVCSTRTYYPAEFPQLCIPAETRDHDDADMIPSVYAKTANESPG